MTNSLCLAPQFYNSKKQKTGENFSNKSLLTFNIIELGKRVRKKINIFKHLKMGKIPATTQIFLAQIMKFPDFLDI